MSEGRWKLSVDQQGVTIAGDRFQLTAAGTPSPEDLAVEENVFAIAESSHIEAIVSELEAMTRRTYGQYCGLSRAMEMVGERWTLLIIRDLSVSPKTVEDLRRGLPRIPLDTLVARMRELEHAYIVRRQERPDETVVYELTDYGDELEKVLLKFGRWGSRMLGDPRPEEIVTTDSMVVAMRAMFDPVAAGDLRATYEIRIDDIVIHVRVDNGTVHAGPGPLPGADLILEAGMALKNMMAGELSTADAIADGSARITGDPVLLERFAEVFHIPSRPSA